jgi:hypothetical protein
MLKNILRYKESVEPQDLQQFVILKDSLELGASVVYGHMAILPIFFLSSSMPSLPSPHPSTLLYLFHAHIPCYLATQTFPPSDLTLSPSSSTIEAPLISFKHPTIHNPYIHNSSHPLSYIPLPSFYLHPFIDQATADKVLDEASRGAVVEHAASFLRPKGGAITAAMAQRFRKQVRTSSTSSTSTLNFSSAILFSSSHSRCYCLYIPSFPQLANIKLRNI